MFINNICLNYKWFKADCYQNSITLSILLKRIRSRFLGVGHGREWVSEGQEFGGEGSSNTKKGNSLNYCFNR